MKQLGIVGGTSWHSTALYYAHLNREVAERMGGLHSARLTLESLDFAAYSACEDSDASTAIVVAAAERLKIAGCDGLLLASNAMHKAVGAVASATGLPIVDIRDATAARLAADGRSHVALLGTRATMTEGFARERLSERGIIIQELPAEWLTEVDRIIGKELVLGRVTRDSQRQLKTLITELAKQRVQAVVLGCTELCLAVDVRANVLPVYDTTAIHAAAAVEWMLDEAVAGADTVRAAA